MSQESSFDITIVGAGLGGVCCAVLLGRHTALRIAIIDPEPQTANCFKAEKIEPDQAALLRKLQLFGAVEQYLTPIPSVHVAWGRKILKTRHLDQYGVQYADLVNGIRSKISSRVTYLERYITAIDPKAEGSTLTLSDGRIISSKVVIISTGTSGAMHRMLGLERETFDDPYSMAFGFSLKPKAEKKFSFDSLTYFPEHLPSSIAFLTLFPFPEVMRANLFSYHQPRDPWVRAIRDTPEKTLTTTLPGLAHMLGDFEAVGKVEAFPISLYSLKPFSLPGVVLLGDSYQSVCPATGSGLSKVFTDVDVLCNQYIPEWMCGTTLTAEKINAYYQDKNKIEVDQRSLRIAQYQKSFAVDSSLQWWFHRHRTFMQLRVEGLKTFRQAHKVVKYEQTYPYAD